MKPEKARKPQREPELLDTILGPLADFYIQYPTLFWVMYGSGFVMVGLYALRFLIALICPRKNEQTYIDEKIKEKRMKLLEKKKQ